MTKGFRTSKLPTNKELKSKVDVSQSKLELIAQVVDIHTQQLSSIKEQINEFDNQFTSLYNVLLEKNVISENDFYASLRQHLIKINQQHEQVLQNVLGLKDADADHVVADTDFVILDMKFKDQNGEYIQNYAHPYFIACLYDPRQFNLPGVKRTTVEIESKIRTMKTGETASEIEVVISDGNGGTKPVFAEITIIKIKTLSELSTTTDLPST